MKRITICTLVCTTAIGTAGEWGLKKGCAVVYTDKGSGTGAHNLETNTAQRIDGTLSTANEPVQFRADLTASERDDFNAASPDRFAWKHAHSKANPEADWGQHVLQSVEFGFWALNKQFGGDHNVNHTSRPYFGLNQRVEGGNSELRYYEILNAHHLDILNGYDGVGDRYVPLHHYYFQALDLMWERLTKDVPLPPSQVVRTIPRADFATPLASANLPPVATQPAAEDRIRLVGGELRIPD